MAGLTPRELGIVVRERLTVGRRERVPEPMVMDEPEAVAQFDRAAAHVLAPVYSMCADAMSPLVPHGGTVFDLGCGAGRPLAELARRRPDVRAVGIDLSEAMLARGEQVLTDAGLADRVTLRHGDMTDFVELMPERVDLVSSVFALHHLPSEGDLARCLAQVATASATAGVLLYDLARLRNPRTWARLLRTGPDLPDRFRWDSLASERAAWTRSEIAEAARRAGLRGLTCSQEPVVGAWQMHVRRPG
jgi:tRNA (cmo5U34)-methyltransferase